MPLDELQGCRAVDGGGRLLGGGRASGELEQLGGGFHAAESAAVTDPVWIVVVVHDRYQVSGQFETAGRAGEDRDDH